MATVAYLRISANDNTRKLANRVFMPVSDQESLSRTAFERFLQLLDDMGWSKKDTVRFFTKKVAEPLGHTGKSITKWYDDKSIPPIHIFNIGIVLGISPNWLAGVSEDRQADEDGVYALIMAGRAPRVAPNKK